MTGCGMDDWDSIPVMERNFIIATTPSPVPELTKSSILRIPLALLPCLAAANLTSDLHVVHLLWESGS